MADNLSPQAGPSQQPVRNKLPVWAWMLIGCGGVGALLFVLAIVAAIAIPNLIQARRNSYETAAAVNLRAYATAQTMYIRTDWHNDGKKEYAHPFTNLEYDASVRNRAPGLLGKGFSAAAGPTGIPKQGYRFQDCKTIGGKPIDWSKDFALCAIPTPDGQTGTRVFIISTDGISYGKDLGPGATFVDDFPADLKAAGWVEAD